VLLGLVIKEMDEVDDIYLQTAYTLGFSQLKTVFLVIFPTALPRIFKHLSSVFGLGWGYIIFAEMINTSGSDTISGIGWLFLARQRRIQIADMYAIFFIIIFFAFLFSFIFKLIGRTIFRQERNGN
jgi:ABC-type nitrate/sulfonate/bicarbonate transport system permease component